MKVDDSINSLKSQIVALAKRIKWLNANRAKLEALPQWQMYGGMVDFDNLPHKEVIAVVRALGGKWNKQKSSEFGRIDYQTEIDGVTVRCWQGEPPPSCRIIEVEEHVPEVVIPAKVIPASVRKVKKMVCSPDFAANMAHAAARAEEVKP
jgi:hypothetical protein